jgi:hypothetical protein
MSMTITLSPELEAALNEAAQRQGVAPESLVLKVLRERFLTVPSPIQPQDEWERQVLGIGTDCGVSLSNEALGREQMYD